MISLSLYIYISTLLKSILKTNNSKAHPKEINVHTTWKQEKGTTRLPDMGLGTCGTTAVAARATGGTRVAIFKPADDDDDA